MSQFLPNNQITLLRNGEEYFPALEAEIDHAEHEIHLQTYIFENDATGQKIAAALMRAAGRKVTVNLLLDGFGSKDFPASLLDALQAAGVNVLFFRPKISPWTLKRNRLRRLHRKVSVFDGHVAFVGGINIIDDFDVPKDKTSPRIDYAVRIEGPLLVPIMQHVHTLWARTAWSQLKPATINIHQLDQPATGDKLAAFVVRDNLRHRRDIENAYLAAIENAKSDIFIANAYFMPGRQFRKALMRAAKRGVRVRLLLQGRMEYFLMIATHAFYSMFLRAGIEIYEYHKSFMHSKVAVIDDDWVTVGSSNIDPFSLLLAREANVVVIDKGFAQTLKQDLEIVLAEGATPILWDDWSRGFVLKRLVSWVVYGFVRFVLGVIGQPKQ
ncbi:cardiolipin synthase ClsB [Methyloradius palustris]|uniref:Cardiolipin synthase B n=1 Tax=Methyloradius palustris TaxID=2778876 RepID=A0A8D5GFW9_9PROT|nr:cardiolipin synthase ClsB [Methyloradius palustris]BCM26004.1 cardiolipin synthase B [Methyloradius palustris]